jgi:hypothetical protein
VKILLDENLPHDLRHHLVGHDPFTVTFMGWSGTKNGELLRRAASAGFEVMLTMDDGVAYQQNPATLPIAVVILTAPSNDIDDLLPLVPAILKLLSGPLPPSIFRVP